MMQAKLLSMTAVLTVLIWASADSLVNETVSVYVLLEPVSAAGATDMIVELESANVSYELQISGPRTLAEKIRDLAPLHVRLPISDRSTGKAAIALARGALKRELVRQWNEFRKLTVVSVRPETMPVVIDHWVSKDVTLVLQRLTLAYEVEPQLERASVTVRMRESRYDELPEGEQLQLEVSADVDRLLKEQPPGQSVTVPVTLDGRSFGAGAQLNPRTISVTATVKAQRTTAEISTVPILVAVAFHNLEKPYRPVALDGSPLAPVTQTIRVTGATDAVARLQRGATRAYGVIHLKQQDMQQTNAPIVLTPEFHLPEGVELAEEPQPIELRLLDLTHPQDGE